MPRPLWRASCPDSGLKKHLGAGRIYSAEFLAARGWQIFDPLLERDLGERGHNLVVRYRGLSYSPVQDDGFVLLIGSIGDGPPGWNDRVDDFGQGAGFYFEQLTSNEMKSVTDELGAVWSRLLPPSD